MIDNNKQEDEVKVEIPEWLIEALKKNREKIMREDTSEIRISKKEAIDIANLDENLKTDFCKHSRRIGISYMSFNKKKVKLVKINNRKYWMVQILGGDISQIEIDKNGGEIFSDGIFSDKELKKLRCLIDAHTGDYIYYPKRKLFSFINDDEDFYDDYEQDNNEEW